MKSVRFHTQGGPEVLSYEDSPNPVLGAGEVLLKVGACGVNRIDIWARNGKYKVQLPHILGTDVAGEVTQVAPGVNEFRPGDRVVVYPSLTDGTCKFCVSGHPNRCIKGGLLGVVSDGGYAEYITVPASNLMNLPSNLDAKTAAAVPVNFGTAWNALVSRACVGPQDTLLVWAAGSGVGSAAIQIGKLFGASVIATAGTDEKLKAARSLGANYTINHSTEDVPEKTRGFTGGLGATVVFDHMGTESWPKSLGSLAKGGKMITLGVTTGESSNVDIGRVYRNELSILGVFSYTKADLAQVISLVSEGRLKPQIFKELPLRSAREAHELLESRSQFGKILLIP